MKETWCHAFCTSVKKRHVLLMELELESRAWPLVQPAGTESKDICHRLAKMDSETEQWPREHGFHPLQAGKPTALSAQETQHISWLRFTYFFIHEIMNSCYFAAF
jgi:hypothetical protein